GTDGSGSAGTTGSTGTSTTGTSGASGTTGTAGTSGSGTGVSSGSSGSTGTSGTTGSSGTTGTTGSTGNGGGAPIGTVVSNLQTTSQKWDSYGQHGPSYVDCSPSPCEGISWSMKPGITLPSLSNNATQFNLGGTTPYGDVLFTTEVIGYKTQQWKDSDHTLLPTLHNFTYDTDFYVTDISITQTLEFDITMYMNGVEMIFGTQCSHFGDHDWDIYDNANHKWMNTGVPCKMVNGWNHLTIQVQRGAGNTLFYKSIELDGVTNTINTTYGPGKASSGWWGLTVNYQMDGNSKPSPNTTYLDNLSLTFS